MVDGYDRENMRINRVHPAYPAYLRDAENSSGQRQTTGERSGTNARSAKSGSEKKGEPTVEKESVSSDQGRPDEPLETVTISLERYESLKQDRKDLNELREQFRNLCAYSLVSIRGEHPRYTVTIDKELLKRWLERLVDHESMEIEDIVWKKGASED